LPNEVTFDFTNKFTFYEEAFISDFNPYCDNLNYHICTGRSRSGSYPTANEGKTKARVGRKSRTD
jgi:hypothetical protein